MMNINQISSDEYIYEYSKNKMSMRLVSIQTNEQNSNIIVEVAESNRIPHVFTVHIY